MAITFDVAARVKASQDNDRETRRRFVKAGVTIAEGCGIPATDKRLQAVWGAYNEPEFKRPFDGGPVPADIQAYYETLDITGNPIVQALIATPTVADSPLSAWGKDVNAKLEKMNEGSYKGLTIPETLNCSDNVVIPAGTAVASLTPKNVARAIWAEWQKLDKRDTAKLAKIHARWAGKQLTSAKADGLVKTLQGLSPAELESIKTLLNVQK